MNKENLHIYKSAEELADQFADQLMRRIENHSGEIFHLAISGGKTPDLLFVALNDKYEHLPLWRNVHFWWVDERMVPPSHPESNFGVAEQLLFSRIELPKGNIHRIKGENDPGKEAKSYSEQIQENLKMQLGWPVFDLILLGMGDDGHTASIFPNQMDLLHSKEICAVATHPISGQKRVTITGKLINHARSVIFLVSGENKSERMNEIFFQPEIAKFLPAAHILPVSGDLNWFLDESAAKLII